MCELSPQEQAEIGSIVTKQEKEFRQKLTSNKNKKFAIYLVRTLHDQIDTLAKKIKTKPTIHFDCKPGCSYCCTLRIEAIAPEIFLLAQHLKKLPEPKYLALVEKLKVHAPSAEGVRMEDFFLECPLLEDGQCSVYEFRPTMCRKYLSMDVEECKKTDSSALEDGEMVMKSSALIYGAANAYSKAKLSSDGYELGQALLLALTDPTAEDRWYRGEVVFQPIPEQSM